MDTLVLGSKAASQLEEEMSTRDLVRIYLGSYGIWDRASARVELTRRVLQNWHSIPHGQHDAPDRRVFALSRGASVTCFLRLIGEE